MLLHKQIEREEAQLLLDGCRKKLTGPTSAQTEGKRKVRPLLDGCRKVTGTASAQTGGERRGRCWMTARRQPVLLLHRQRKREEAQLLLDGCRKLIGPTSAQTGGEREARPLLDGCTRISPP